MTKIILPVILLACLLLLSGCIQTPVQNPTPTATIPVSPAPATATPGTTVPETSVPATTTVVPATLTETPAATPAPTPEPVDVSKIKFVQYADSDFAMDYPATWNITRTTYYSSICTSTENSRCFANEIKNIGPFNFSESSVLKKPSRITRFESPDGRLKVVAFVSDFRDSVTGLYQINPDIAWVMNRVHAIFPDVSGLAAVSDYKYDRSANAMTFSYTVILPKLTEDYPLAYASENFVTVHRDYEFVFMTDNEDFLKYRNLRERILSSIVPNDIV